MRCAAIAGVLPAVEIVDSRVADWKIKLVDTVADNASSGLLVVGGRMRQIDDFDLRLLGVVVSRQRRDDRHRRRARPRWATRRGASRGWPTSSAASGAGLKAGDVVLPGAPHRW